MNDEQNEIQQQDTQTSDKGKKLSPVIIVVIVIALATVIGGVIFLRRNTANNSQAAENLSQDESVLSAEQQTDTSMQDSSAPDGAMKSDVQTISVEGGNYYFKPNEIRVKKGETVRIVFTNSGGTHDWVIDEFNARTKLTQSGETSEVEFVADKAGEFEFYCSVGNHRQLGMKGTLIVE
jgi:plastocyanin